MSYWKFKCCLVFLIALILCSLPYPANAARGDLASQEFGYGAWIEIDSPNLVSAVQQAAIIQLDWLAVDLDWADRWPDPAQQPQLDDLDQLMELARQHRLSVMISVHHAPSWARNASGPDPIQTGWFIANLALRYPEVLQAVEIFPGGNLAVEWGAPANPAVYLAVLKEVTLALQPTNLNPLIVAGGLAPNGSSASSDMDSLAFLTSLYELGGLPYLNTISVQIPAVQGKPLDAPLTGGPPVLRFYEEIRQVMVDHKHSNGKIWITRLAFMTGKNLINDVSLIPEPDFSDWLLQAFRQARSQLYIGVGFFVNLNTPQHLQLEKRTIFLSGSNGQPDDFVKVLKSLIVKSKNSTQQLPDFTKPQKRHLTKNRPADP